MKSRLKFKKVRLTTDKAMYSDENLSYFEERKGYEYIVACPLKKLIHLFQLLTLTKLFQPVKSGRGCKLLNTLSNITHSHEQFKIHPPPGKRAHSSFA